MEVELLEIRQFLEQRPPFNFLDDEQLDALPADMEIRYLRRGSKFPPEDGYLYIVRSGAIELRDQEGEICEKIAEGDIYTTSCQLLNFRRECRGATAEDTLVYIMTCDRLMRCGRDVGNDENGKHHAYNVLRLVGSEGEDHHRHEPVGQFHHASQGTFCL